MDPYLKIKEYSEDGDVTKLRRSQRLATTLNKTTALDALDRYNLNTLDKLLEKKQRSRKKANVKSQLKHSSDSASILEGIGTETFSEQFPPNQQSFTGYCDSGAAEMKTETPVPAQSQKKLASELLGKNIKICGSTTAITTEHLECDIATRMSPIQLLTIDLCSPDTGEEQFVMQGTERKKRKKRNIQIDSLLHPLTSQTKEKIKMPKRSVAHSNKKTRNKSHANAKDFAPSNGKQLEGSIPMTLPLHPLRYYDNTKDYNPFASKTYILPPVYPPHFIHQRRISECGSPIKPYSAHSYSTSSHWPPQTDIQNDLYSTPDFLQSYDFDILSTSTPSLPDSLRGVFETNDIREILHADKVAYRLCEHHVQALAFVLNLSVDYLHYMLESILKLSASAVQNINAALETSLADETQTASTSTKHNPPENIESPKRYAVEIIDCSPSGLSAGQQRYFPSQRLVKK